MERAIEVCLVFVLMLKKVHSHILIAPFYLQFKLWQRDREMNVMAFYTYIIFVCSKDYFVIKSKRMCYPKCASKYRSIYSLVIDSTKRNMKNFYRSYSFVLYRVIQMIVGVLTTCHTQYTWDSSICFFLFNRTTLQIFCYIPYRCSIYAHYVILQTSTR